jgi:hypothetical protein
VGDLGDRRTNRHLVHRPTLENATTR